jgi:NAD(P)-dependent dehydrogenase (short-subunit alcohol dehydrogenase family)
MTQAPVAIITGAGSGVGRATCLRLADAGWRIALVGRREAALRETAEQIEPMNSNEDLLVLPADITADGAPRLIVDRIQQAWGRIDALVNNAGVAPLVDIEKTDAQLLGEVFSVNAFAPALLIAAAWPVMKARKSGRVVNIASMAVIDPFPGFFMYGAAKSALESLTRSIMNEGAEHGIRAFTIAPGAIETDMLRALFSRDMLPADQALDPDAVADVVVQCVTGRRDDDAGTRIALSATS